MAIKPDFASEPIKRKQRYPKAAIKFSFIMHRHCVVFVVGCLVVLTLIGAASGQDWHDTYGGHGTTHEQLGQLHYPHPDLTPYVSKVQYTYEMNRTSWAIVPAYNVSHLIFDSLITDVPALPRGYLEVKNGTTLQMGHKFEENDFASLLSQYWLIMLWVLFLLFLIILLPFIAVCYCCFCCCRRCKMGCGPCDAAGDKRRSCICAGILLLLLILLLIGAIIGFTSNRELDRGLDESKNTIVRSSEDTCRFLQDVSEHIQHIFILNYEELEAHLTEILNNAHSHIFLDLGDTSESNALEELERIFDNMPQALRLFKQVEVLDAELRFLASQLRDGVRGVKRDINFMCSNLMKAERCEKFLTDSELEFIDIYTCLHLDKLPTPELHISGAKESIANEDALIPKRALQRFQAIGLKIEEAVSVIIPPMLEDLANGRELFQLEASKVRNIIDQLVSNIQLRTLRSTQSFEDIHDKLSRKRSYINAAVCIVLFLLIIILAVALICGCFFNKGTGATCLLIAIILAFCIFSIITLIALLYFIMGLISYQGACAPLRDQEANAMFRELDSAIDLKRLMSDTVRVSNGGYPGMRMSQAIKSCMANETIFDLLSANNLYNLDDLTNLAVMTEKDDDSQKDIMFDEDLSEVFLLTINEKVLLQNTVNGNLSSYHSILYTDYMCDAIVPNLITLRNQIQKLFDDYYLYGDNDKLGRYAHTAMLNEIFQLTVYNNYWPNRVKAIMKEMKQKLLRIDDLILYENRNFSDSVAVLIRAVERSEVFIRTRGVEFINALGDNLTDVVNEQVEVFIENIISESSSNVGHCAPLAYIYNRGVDLVCYRLVDPMNGFWVGILPAALLLLPLIYVAHKLMCLWRRLHSYGGGVVVVPVTGGCPTCTGAAYVPPAVITCGGGQQAYCVCNDAQQTRTDGGATDPINDSSEESVGFVAEQPPPANPVTVGWVAATPPPPPAKRKRD